MTQTLTVVVGDLKGKMQLTGSGHTDSRVAIDYPPPLGEDNGFTSLELLMVSLASCSSHSIQYVLGTMGIKVEGLPAHDAIMKVNEGEWAEEISSGKTELSEEERKKLEEEKKRLQEELKAKRDEYLSTGKGILKSMEGKKNKDIRARMTDAGLPMAIVNELAPEEKEEKK